MPIPFRPIACMLTRTLHPTPQVDLSAARFLFASRDPASQPTGLLVTVNHYSAQGFHAWWITLLISACLPVKIHWVVTSAWENSGWLTDFTHWLFPLGARSLGFTSMPAMPPRPAETFQRADAVRKVLHYARYTPGAVIGLAPEGRDSPGGALSVLPPGVGRFVYLLSQHCSQVLPVGIWTEGKQIRLRFGDPYHLDVPSELSNQDRDRLVGEAVMRAIARCLPERLRGAYQ